VHKYPEYLTQTDSYNAIPLHLAAFYPSTSVHVLQHLLNLHPRGAKSLDNQSMTPLHRACKSRSSLPKVIALVEAAPCVLSWRDWCGNTPLELADRMDHRLGDIIPEVVGLLELVEETMQLRLDPGNALDSNRTNIDVRRQRAGEVLMRFRFIGWQSGIPMAFAHNIHLFDLMAVPTILNPELLSCFSSNKTVRVENDEPENNDASNITGTNRLNALYSLLKHQPWICGGGM
jgi:ankyrin repeat protein